MCRLQVVRLLKRVNGSVVLGPHRDVDDGEHHEDERLQGDDQDVEDRPGGAREDVSHHRHAAAEAEAGPARAQQREYLQRWRHGEQARDHGCRDRVSRQLESLAIVARRAKAWREPVDDRRERKYPILFSFA